VLGLLFGAFHDGAQAYAMINTATRKTRDKSHRGTAVPRIIHHVRTTSLDDAV
jgi:hypothetical protein